MRRRASERGGIYVYKSLSGLCWLFSQVVMYSTYTNKAMVVGYILPKKLDTLESSKAKEKETTTLRSRMTTYGSRRTVGVKEKVVAFMPLWGGVLLASLCVYCRITAGCGCSHRLDAQQVSNKLR